MAEAVISMWGNSHALRIPAKLIGQMGLAKNDKVYLESDNDRLIITKAPLPKKGTLEYLFKDYSGGSFKTRLVNPVKPASKHEDIG
ncbi:hypothetical protein AGMMS49928_03370 [Spirochaetia bacterium]|nr:hypothetical protein AGMMS49928_03370 [Spirochaetia bacterium]